MLPDHAGPHLTGADLTGAGRLAVIVPCLDEAAAVGAVVTDLRRALPGAVVHVYDDGNTDGTAAAPRRHGAVVRYEQRPGKGHVLRRAFADVDADADVLIDGDDTYDAAAAAQLVEVLLAGPHDHVVGVRRAGTATAHRPGHAAGNRALDRAIGTVFAAPVTDALSGYRVMSRRFVKSFPARSRGFEVETEMTVHAITHRVPRAEVPVGFRDRPAGSASELRTVRDGVRIAAWILSLAHEERPLAVAALVGGLLAAAAAVPAAPVVAQLLATGAVPRPATALLAACLGVLAVLVAAVGLVLDAVRRSRHHTARLVHLAHPAPGTARRGPGARRDPSPGRDVDPRERDTQLAHHADAHRRHAEVAQHDPVADVRAPAACRAP